MGHTHTHTHACMSRDGQQFHFLAFPRLNKGVVRTETWLYFLIVIRNSRRRLQGETFPACKIVTTSVRANAAAAQRLQCTPRDGRLLLPSSTIHPPPSTLHPPPSTLHPPPSALHPPPSTLHPQFSPMLHNKNHTPSTILSQPPPSPLPHRHCQKLQASPTRARARAHASPGVRTHSCCSLLTLRAIDTGSAFPFLFYGLFTLSILRCSSLPSSNSSLLTHVKKL